jgi:hypothetical protein
MRPSIKLWNTEVRKLVTSARTQTVWRNIFLVKLTAFCLGCSVITVFTGARNWFVSWATRVKSF